MKRRDEVLVGLLTTAALVAGEMGTLWLARGGLQPGYPLYAKFAWGSGLKQGQPVLLSGVNVGYVDAVDFLPDGHLVVTFRVGRSYQVPKGTTASIKPNGFFGDQMIALEPQAPSTSFYAAEDTVPAGKPATDLGAVLATVDSIGQSVKSLARAMDKSFVAEGGMADLRKSITTANTLMADLSEVAKRQDAELARTQAALRRVAGAVDSAQVDSTVRALQDAGQNVAALSKDLKETTTRLNALIAKVDSGPGSAGRLMNDPGLYTDVRGLVQRLDSLTADFKKNPKKYVKLSIF